LFVNIHKLFPPDWRETAIAGYSFTPAEVAYAQCPMGNDGFITTKNVPDAIHSIENHNLKAQVVGTLEKATAKLSGVILQGIKDSKGGNVYFSGRD
jgi:hypothetical protein